MELSNEHGDVNRLAVDPVCISPDRGDAPLRSIQRQIQESIDKHLASPHSDDHGLSALLSPIVFDPPYRTRNQ